LGLPGSEIARQGAEGARFAALQRAAVSFSFGRSPYGAGFRLARAILRQGGAGLRQREIRSRRPSHINHGPQRVSTWSIRAPRRREVVWNEGQSGGATGGGISDVFDLPSWQKAAKVPASANPGGRIGRGVPDVAGDADPQTGYQVLVDGQEMVIGGTSAVAPLWAGLVALMNEGLGHRAGYLNPVLYGLPTTTRAFRDIAVGNNDTTGNGGAYPARRGWDACTGLGSPVGKKLLAALSHG